MAHMLDRLCTRWSLLVSHRGRRSPVAGGVVVLQGTALLSLLLVLLVCQEVEPGCRRSQNLKIGDEAGTAGGATTPLSAGRLGRPMILCGFCAQRRVAGRRGGSCTHCTVGWSWLPQGLDRKSQETHTRAHIVHARLNVYSMLLVRSCSR